MKIVGPVSVGDFLDRMSILEIKLEMGLNVEAELEFYKSGKVDLEKRGFEHYFSIIKRINEELWKLEDEKRKKVKRYSQEYSDVSTLITQLNDLRYQTKMRIDIYFDSDIREQKSHD